MKPIENKVGKGEKLVISVSPFPAMFSALSKTNQNIRINFIFLYANVFNFLELKILSFGRIDPFQNKPLF